MAKRTQVEGEDLDLVLGSLKTIKKELKEIRKSAKGEMKMAYTNQDVMEMFDVGTKTLKKWRDSGALSFSLLGSIYLYSKQDIQNFLNKNHFEINF